MTAAVPLLVGREEESGLLRRRWEQSKAGLGQVVFVSGEAGIGKSALVEGLRAQVRAEGLPRIAFRCSPYHTTSALYPVITHIEHLRRVRVGRCAPAIESEPTLAAGGSNDLLRGALPRWTRRPYRRGWYSWRGQFLYQRGRPPRARYLFKHALIQDAAYACVAQGTRQQVHQQRRLRA